MFFNISNHPSAQWGAEQKEAVSKFGTIIDIQFPNVHPSATINEITVLAENITRQVLELSKATDGESGAMVQGEYTTVYQILKKLDPDIEAFAATSTKNSSGEFQFVLMRPYEED